MSELTVIPNHKPHAVITIVKAEYPAQLGATPGPPGLPGPPGRDGSVIGGEMLASLDERVKSLEDWRTANDTRDLALLLENALT